MYASVFFHKICEGRRVAGTNVHRLLCACVCIARKLCEDTPVPQRAVARAAGVWPLELLRLERAALHLLAWRLYVPEDAYEAEHAALVALGRGTESSGREGPDSHARPEQ